MTCKPPGERLDEQSQRIAFVPVIDSTRGKQGPRWCGVERCRIIRRFSLRGESPPPWKPFAFLVQALGQRVRRNRGRRVEHHRFVLGRPCSGEWIGRENFPASAERGNAAHVWIRTRENH